MSTNENLLALGSLWDSETFNAELDERRQAERDRKSRLHLRDAIVELGLAQGFSVRTAGIETAIHVRRMGMMWVDGFMCGSTTRAVVSLSAIVAATRTEECGCGSDKVSVFDLVTFGAVFRELERSATVVSVVANRFGIRGRITGVWRDAITVQSQRNVVVIPLTSLEMVLVDEAGWT